MPAHISHLLFAEDALREATPDAEWLLERTGNLFRFGAQGPDVFYHNQRTRPVALRYGSLIHRRGFGTMVAHMTQTALTTARRTGNSEPQQVAYLLGFATHAELDRFTHPYIICRAGWVRAEDPDSQRYRRCHVFLERLLDVAALRALRSRELHQFDFFSQIYCGESLPYSTLKMLVKAINGAYPTASYKSRNRRRVENAYGDAMRFYTLTDHRNPLLRRRALELDRREGDHHRRGAVFHFPDAGQELDPANLRRRPWPHPCFPEVSSEESFLDLMAAAQAALVPRLARLAAILGLRGSRVADPAVASGGGAGELFAELVNLFGDQSLGANRHGSTCTPVHADPLPLAELLERLYRESVATTSC
jgi:hypothetical protein